MPYNNSIKSYDCYVYATENSDSLNLKAMKYIRYILRRWLLLYNTNFLTGFLVDFQIDEQEAKRAIANSHQVDDAQTNLFQKVWQQEKTEIINIFNPTFK